MKGSCKGKFEEGLCKGERAIKSAVKLRRVPAAGCYSAEHPGEGKGCGSLTSDSLKSADLIMQMTWLGLIGGRREAY